MCGIIGYVGGQSCERILLDGLKKLAYRGYDSAGIALCTEQGMKVVKAKGRIDELERHLSRQALPPGTIGIGHTRRATHGKPSDANSHPHTDALMKISVVHNGIVDNEAELRKELKAQGAVFRSETDTEVISHLIASHYTGDIVQAVQAAARRIRGAYALAVLSELEPDKLVAVRQMSPLMIGVGDGERFVGSDLPAILEHTRDVYILGDGEMAVLTREETRLMTIQGDPIAKRRFRVNWDLATAEKAGYDHFMLKEIFEQPKAYRDTLEGRLFPRYPWTYLPELSLTPERLKQFQRVRLVGCGSSYHAGLVGKMTIERWAQLPADADAPSDEYRRRSPLATPETLVIVVSHSGETADTLAALHEAKRHGAHTIAVTGAVGSTAAREADDVLFARTGSENAVVSTKSYTTQLLVLYVFALHLARVRGTMADEEIEPVVRSLKELSDKVGSLLMRTKEIEGIAEEIASHERLIFLGQGLDYAVALEGSIKLKEVSRMEAEACALGEPKLGKALPLLKEGAPIVALATQPELQGRTAGSVREAMARGAAVLGVGSADAPAVAERRLTLPETHPALMPALAVVPLQLLAYYAAVARGCEVDKPRDPAHRVTAR